LALTQLATHYKDLAACLDRNPTGSGDKAALGVAYGAGLRVSEVANLKVSDIDSERRVLRVEQGKGKKDRNGMLSPRLLELPREWWCMGQPTTWLFPGRDPLLPITTRQLYRVVRDAADANAGPVAPASRSV
jgi:integrase